MPQPSVRPEHQAELRQAAGARATDFLIGGVGRLTEGKGFDVLIEAFGAAALPESRLVIVGEGGERRRLERLAAGLPVYSPDTVTTRRTASRPSTCSSVPRGESRSAA